MAQPGDSRAGGTDGAASGGTPDLVCARPPGPRRRLPRARVRLLRATTAAARMPPTSGPGRALRRRGETCPSMARSRPGSTAGGSIFGDGTVSAACQWYGSSWCNLVLEGAASASAAIARSMTAASSPLSGRSAGSLAIRRATVSSSSGAPGVRCRAPQVACSRVREGALAAWRPIPAAVRRGAEEQHSDEYSRCARPLRHPPLFPGGVGGGGDRKGAVAQVHVLEQIEVTASSSTRAPCRRSARQPDIRGLEV